MGFCVEEHYLTATEWQLATLEQLCERKSTSKSDIQRQREIVRAQLQVCQEIDPLFLRPVGSHSRKFPRVEDFLEAARKEPSGLLGVIDRYINGARAPRTRKETHFPA